MKKLWISILVVLVVFPMMFQSSVKAATPISIIIDGVRLSTDQAPVMVNGRTMVPLRAIFEAFNATIKWNQKAQTVTATKDDTTIMLKIGSKTATINNKAVTLDVPGLNLKGRTMVPTRFVSEALGHEVGWNPKTQVVTITTSASNVGNAGPVSNVVAQDVSDFGDGRDLQVSFTRAANESLVDHYRVLIVKSGNILNLSSAQTITSYNYSTVLPTGTNPSIQLTSASRTVDGDSIKSNQAYVAYVLTVGKGSNTSALSSGSSIMTLVNKTVAAINNVQVNDISDYGDGRDLSVSFNKLSDESKVSSYRIFVVKAINYSNFNLATANNVTSANYTLVSKTGNNITQILSSGARDVDGALVKTGVSYRVFAMAIDSSNAANNVLSSVSSAITLSNIGVSNLSVSDVNNYNDGRDLRVSFTHATDETYISQYRILVVPTSYYSSFSLAEANNITSAYYTAVSTTGTTTNQVLTSSTRDVRGALIKNGVNYKVYIFSIGSSNTGNVLSSPSSVITLLNDSSVSIVSNLNVSDVNDYGDGRDLRVSFTHATDETYISQYRIMVVPTSYYSSFSLAEANNVSSSNYTSVSTSGSSTSQVLNSSTRDVLGALIKNGTSYRVYVLTIGSGIYWDSNVLSSASSVITLLNDSSVKAVTNLSVSDVNDYGDGRDLKVSFSHATDETYINQYRIMVVPTSYYSSFSLSEANNVSSSNYTSVSTSGNSTSQVLDASARDVRGNLIKDGTSYKVYVLSVGSGNYAGPNALSWESSVITLSTTKSPVSSVTNVTYKEENGRILISFVKSANESNISEYRVLVVPSKQGFGSADAIEVRSSYYTSVTPNGTNPSISTATRDVNGDSIVKGVKYKVYVLAVANNSGVQNGGLSNSTEEFEI
ncbi:copper amine oxidase N-terminal domain-containing protein [Paenibacillus sp. G2S3]|uniref:copper amine oxidase N-terminal domain-containing protein n=1 Tax=Paenibacillus sp. G2S3 TaxID=3047872 RepID=UPI0024C13E85|nr:copper amine oxidase N-terminal domain-containing protein [Paenibacillus sp. G2S3]WHY18715.1 copper amine oxidase N-terminal domain-containing protein [Paenibacillus sp. G2S3]